MFTILCLIIRLNGRKLARSSSGMALQTEDFAVTFHGLSRKTIRKILNELNKDSFSCHHCNTILDAYQPDELKSLSRAEEALSKSIAALYVSETTAGRITEIINRRRFFRPTVEYSGSSRSVANNQSSERRVVLSQFPKKRVRYPEPSWRP